MNGLLGSQVLEVALGAAFVYLLLAAFCTSINEWIAGLLSARAENLKVALRELLNGQKFTDGKDFLAAFYDHPVITSLMKNCAHPSYLPARSFSTAIMDLSTASVKGSITFADLESGLKALPDGEVRTSLLALIQNVNGDLSKAQASIENWFNDTMDRASGWYKRRTLIWTIVVASVLTIAVNADTLGMLHQFWIDPTVRSKIVADAAHADQQNIDALGQVLGWRSGSVPASPLGWMARLIGWSFTIVAVSLGAPFWFDMLSRFVNLRNSGRPPGDKDKTVP